MSINSTTLRFIKEGVASWAIGVVLDKLLELVTALDDIDKKLERLVNAPFETAKRAFELAQTHAHNEEHDKYKAELERARTYFDDAASNSKGLEKVHALYLAGLCCDLIAEKTKKEFYYGEAIKAIDSFISDKSVEKKNHVIAATVTGGAVGLAAGGYSIFWLLASIMWVSGVGIFSPLLFVVGVAGGTMASGGAISLSARKITSLLKGNIKDKKFESLDFTVGDLRSALLQGVGNNS